MKGIKNKSNTNIIKKLIITNNLWKEIQLKKCSVKKQKDRNIENRLTL